MNNRSLNSASRREFLQGVTVAGAGVLAVAAGLGAQNTPNRTRRGRIDVHHHHRPAEFGGGNASTPWTPAQSIEQMDKFGIATAPRLKA